MRLKPNTLIVVAGPTASGKTALAIQIAKAVDGEIVSADSMQIYRGVDIATAKPTPEELAAVPHHLIGFLPMDRAFSVADYAELARKEINDILSRGKVPVLCGGTGLYIKAIVDNVQYSEAITGDEALRERLRQELGREPSLSELSERIGWTPEEIAQIDLATEKPDSLQRETAEGLALEGILGTEAPEDALVERIALREAVNQLPEKERMTILLRYFKGLTQERAARVLGVSQVQVSRLERRGLERLRQSFAE